MSPLQRKKLLARLDNAAAPTTAASRHAQHRRRREHASAWSAVVFIFIVLTICVSPNLLQQLPTSPSGTIWPHPNLVTPYALVIPDGDAARLKRQQLQADHMKVFQLDRELESESVDKATAVIQMINDVGETSAPGAIRSAVRRRTGVDLRHSTIETFATSAANERTTSDLATVFHHLYEERGVSADKSLLNSAIRSERAIIRTTDGQAVSSTTLRNVLGYPGEAFEYTENAYLATFQISPETRAAYADLLRQVLKPNIAFDREGTEDRLQQAMAAVNPKKVLEPGSTVIRRGEMVTPITVAAIELIEEQEWKNEMLRLLGGAILVLLAMTFTGLYAKRFNRDLRFTSRSVLMVALPVVMAVSLGRVIINMGGGMLLGAFALPAGMVGILTVMLFDERFAIVLTTMACALFAASTGLALPYTLMGLVGGYTAILSLRNLQERREVMTTGLYIAAANFTVALAIGLILNPANPDLTAGLIAAVVNGVVCYMLAVAALPIFENVFQVTTDVLLLELTGANHKLLQMMEEKAPGSLHHSMNVANLAESAAEAVGAHYLLVRAGAYFHDIGKMIKPTYFTENQSTPEQKQIHSKLSPAMSTLIIKNHVKEGVELARAYRLPEKVIDFIPEHHGTTLIKFFYVQALKKAEMEGSDEIISEDEYRYPGPKPRSVETAILMLADSVEAISTSRFAGKTPDDVEIRRAVHEAVTEKYEDRQLTNSPLTFRDVEIIKDAFARVLLNRYHQRIKYPKMPGAQAAGAGAQAARQGRKSEESRKSDEPRAASDGERRLDGKQPGGTATPARGQRTVTSPPAEASAAKQKS